MTLHPHRAAPHREAARTWRPHRRIDVGETLSAVRRGAGDPTWLDVAGAGPVKAWRTPDGPVAVLLAEDRADRAIVARAWGSGAGWLLDRLPRLLGADDDPTGFVPRHDVVARAHRAHAGLAVPATGLVVESLVPTVLEQRVTGQEAFAAYRRLVRRFGEPAPGPWAASGLRVAPDAAGWARVPSWAWLRAGVDARRAETIRGALARAGRLEALAELPLAEARSRLGALPGVGRWTVAEVAHTALGDADAVSFGDYHVAADIGWALTGTPTDDAGLEVLLRPYAGHRYRVQRLLELAGHRRPRRGPRARPRPHLPVGP